jgi:hypothetical protein
MKALLSAINEQLPWVKRRRRKAAIALEMMKRREAAAAEWAAWLRERDARIKQEMQAVQLQQRTALVVQRRGKSVLAQTPAAGQRVNKQQMDSVWVDELHTPAVNVALMNGYGDMTGTNQLMQAVQLGRYMEASQAIQGNEYSSSPSPASETRCTSSSSDTGSSASDTSCASDAGSSPAD